MPIFDFISGIFRPVTALVDDLVHSGEEKAEARARLLEIQAQFQQSLMEHEAKIVSEQASVIRAEASGNGVLARNWRPITMLVFVAIIANNYIIAPYVASFGGNVPTLEIPNGMWSLLNVGIGGYILSRGVEKSVEKWRNGSAENGERGALG